MARKLRNQTIKDGADTNGARFFAQNTYNSPNDVKLNWWEFFSNYRIKRWKQELKNLHDKTGISFEYVCRYMGAEILEMPGFYRKVPKLKETYIAIGMAYKLPLSTINRWLVKYGGKKKLYVKDVLNDLIWVYLINANFADKSSDVNYYNKFEECRELIEEIYVKMNSEISDDDIDTADMDEIADNVLFDSEYLSLKKFVKDNIASFNSAYTKVKNFLNGYIENILKVKNDNRLQTRKWTLNSLRGYLDDSMINYITSGIKYVPKNKRIHIATALALGMTTEDIDEYLELLGYAPLDGTYLEEGLLINMLEKWEEEHPEQRTFKERHIYNRVNTEMDPNDEIKAIDDMLKLRSEIKEVWDAFLENSHSKEKIRKFPYMND